MKNKAKLAFELLEQEMEVICKREMEKAIGGVQRDSSGNIIFTATGTESGYDRYGNYVEWTAGYILADDGTQIVAYRNHPNSSSGYDTDCHGTTFSDGEFWINNDQACGIIDGDGYTQVGSSSSSGGYAGYSIGDVVVYYDENGGLAHSLTITGFDENGVPIVYGQGGTEIFNSSCSITSGWANYSSYQVYRK